MIPTQLCMEGSAAEMAFEGPDPIRIQRRLPIVLHLVMTMLTSVEMMFSLLLQRSPVPLLFGIGVLHCPRTF